MKKLNINHLHLTGKYTFIRVDFNIPIHAGTIQDDSRIQAALPTIRHAIAAGARLVLASHLGRPNGSPDPKYSLAPVANRLSELLGQAVHFNGETTGLPITEVLKTLTNGEVLLLENLRFHSGETTNDPDFAKELASFADIYVNDAFGAAHRSHASTVGVVKHFSQAAAGLLMDKELSYLDMALASPPHPFIGILGGAKISDKIEVVQSLLSRVDKLLIGGGMAYTFLSAKGIKIGESIVEKDKVDLAHQLLEEGGSKLLLPCDHVVASTIDADAKSRVCPIATTPKGWMGLDIGPKTIDKYSDTIRAAKMILWNGPMGLFEIDAFATGTLKLANVIASSQTISIVGGGDSIAAVRKAGVTGHIDHISTGGGASLEFLAGKTLPGIEVLTDEPS